MQEVDAWNFFKEAPKQRSCASSPCSKRTAVTLACKSRSSRRCLAFPSCERYPVHLKLLKMKPPIVALIYIAPNILACLAKSNTVMTMRFLCSIAVEPVCFVFTPSSLPLDKWQNLFGERREAPAHTSALSLVSLGLESHGSAP